MGSTNPFGGEGSSINRPPIFAGEGYAYWKVRMRIFIEAIDTEIWDAVENGPFIPMHMINEVVHEKPKSAWNEDDKKKVQYNLKAKNIITSALSYDEFFRVSQCVSAKEMWDTLQVTHEGTSEVKRARLNALCHEYELFRMLPNESIQEMQKRFTHIVNHLISLGKTFIGGELTHKVLRCLDRAWQPKVTAIMESKDLGSMDLATLFGKLQEHEMELSRLNLHEDSDRKKKSISLKATSSRTKSVNERSVEDDDSEDSEIDDETLTLLVRKFGKFFNKSKTQRSKGHSRNRDSNKRSSTTKENTRCHECGKLGHIRLYCPQYIKKNENNRSDSKDTQKGKRAYIVWDSPEEQSAKEDSSSSDEEVANLCLMGMHDAEASNSDSTSRNNEVSDYDSDVDSNSNNPTYDELYNAFKELLEELKAVAKVSAERKRTILQHEKKILEMQKIVDELKLENETLDLIYANSSCDCSSKNSLPKVCENCNILEKENLALKKQSELYVKGKNNLNTILSSQRASGNTYGLGYKEKKFRKLDGQNFHNNNSKFSCNYCGLPGHTSSTCKIKRHDIPKGHMIWCVKGHVPKTNPKGPKTIWVPKRST